MGGQSGARRVEPGHVRVVTVRQPTFDVGLGARKRLGTGYSHQVEAQRTGKRLELVGQSRNESTAMNASWGISTWPSRFMRFLPSACFSSSLRLRVMSPP